MGNSLWCLFTCTALCSWWGWRGWRSLYQAITLFAEGDVWQHRPELSSPAVMSLYFFASPNERSAFRIRAALQETEQIKVLHSSSVPPWHHVPSPERHSHQPKSQRPRRERGWGSLSKTPALPLKKSRQARSPAPLPRHCMVVWEAPSMASSPPGRARDEGGVSPLRMLQSGRCSTSAAVRIVQEQQKDRQS